MQCGTLVILHHLYEKLQLNACPNGKLKVLSLWMVQKQRVGFPNVLVLGWFGLVYDSIVCSYLFLYNQI